MLKLQTSIKAVLIKFFDSPIHVFPDIICWWDIYIMYSTIIINFFLNFSWFTWVLFAYEYRVRIDIVWNLSHYGLLFLHSTLHSFNLCKRYQLFHLSVNRIFATLKLTDPDLIQMDDFKNEQLLSITINLLLFIRSQVPVTTKLFQSCECTQKDREICDKCS